jgi:hypothetical protein
MKTLHQLVIAAAVAAAINVASSARADEPLFSPKAKENQIRTMSSVAANEPNLAANRPAGNAKAADLAQSFRTVHSMGPSVDIAHAPRPNLSPKDSNFEAAWRANAQQQYQVAPLK